MAESFNSLYMRDPAAADRQRRAAQAQALMRAGSDASALQGTGNNSMQAIARALQGITGGVMSGMASREAKTAGEEAKAAEQERGQRIAAALSGMPMPGAGAPMQAPPSAPPMTENLGGAPNAPAPAPVPQVQRSSLGAPPAGMYGRNASRVAERDAMLAAPPEVLADASQQRATETNGLPPGTSFRANEGVGGVYAGLPPPSGAVPPLASGGGAPQQAAPQQAPQPQGRNPAALRQSAALLLQGGSQEERAAAQMLWSQADAIERDQGQQQERTMRRGERLEDRSWQANTRAEEIARQDRQRAEDIARRQAERQADIARQEAARLDGGVPTGYTVGPDGVARRREGLPEPVTPATQPTEGERKAASYLERMQGAEDILARLTRPTDDLRGGEGYTPGNVRDRAASFVPFVSNFLTSEEGQRYLNAASEWARAKLRLESGAVISDAEAESEARTYFPMPGESEKSAEQKKELRDRAMSAIRRQAGRAGADLPAPAAGGAPVAPPSSPGGPPPPPPGFTVVQ